MPECTDAHSRQSYKKIEKTATLNGITNIFFSPTTKSCLFWALAVGPWHQPPQESIRPRRRDFSAASGFACRVGICLPAAVTSLGTRRGALAPTRKLRRLSPSAFFVHPGFCKQACNAGHTKKAQNFRSELPVGAEREGFEPPDPLRSTVFKTAAFDHSAISPI